MFLLVSFLCFQDGASSLARVVTHVGTPLVSSAIAKVWHGSAGGEKVDIRPYLTQYIKAIEHIYFHCSFVGSLGAQPES